MNVGLEADDATPVGAVTRGGHSKLYRHLDLNAGVETGDAAPKDAVPALPLD